MPMIAIGDEEALYLLEFGERSGLEREIDRLKQKTNAPIVSGTTAPIRLLEKELSQYFEGKLTEFKTPLFFMGSPFQKKVWEELLKIPFGERCSYSNIAQAIGRPTAFRAVARAISTNQLAIVIPCHRVLSAKGSLSGYAGGLAQKQWLLDHERKPFINSQV